MNKEQIEERIELMKIVGEKLRKLREKRNLTQSEVAKMNGISLRSYSKYECGHAMMYIRTLFKLAKFYGVKITYLVDEKPNS